MCVMPPACEIARIIIIKLDSEEFTRVKVPKLKIALESFQGINPVCIHIKGGDRKVVLTVIDIADIHESLGI